MILVFAQHESLRLNSSSWGTAQKSYDFHLGCRYYTDSDLEDRLSKFNGIFCAPPPIGPGHIACQISYPCTIDKTPRKTTDFALTSRHRNTHTDTHTHTHTHTHKDTHTHAHSGTHIHTYTFSRHALWTTNFS